ncbi:hypothetical protein EI293_20135 [Hymenobacter perfusus]|uniref:L,D-TPase catalytic domain-containing protein n=1 Tax=Hymenobacter perfusus TaxID=1236770 RepID=A0A428JZE1_9BACT|nr:hypothetical protein EI293_20135 [Hymenobacter perfusus]
MDWLRSTVRSALLLVLLTGCAFSLEAHPGKHSERVTDVEMTAARATLRSLLDTRQRGPAATYRQLGLMAGPAVQTFYTTQQYATCWVQETGWNSRARQALTLLSRAADVGLDPNRYAWATLQDFPDSLRQTSSTSRNEQLALSELRLTDALLRYTTHLRQGYLLPETLTPAPAADSLTAGPTANLLQQALLAPDFTTVLLGNQPTARAYRLLQGAWVRSLHASPSDSARLMQDTTAGFHRVALNLERLRWAAPADSEYAVVNIPAYRLQLIRNGQVIQTHRVIVGKPEWPTPVLSSRIAVFVTSPEWRVPYSIAVREFLPELQRDPGYLYDNHYRMYDGRGRQINPWQVNWQKMTPQKFSYAIRQRAGSFNALGSVVFYFPNQQTVFLHDTPARSAFTRTERALSHGCVRVEKPFKLAEYLLRREDRAQELTGLYQSVRQHEKQRFDLQRSLPIYLRYYTCETDNGRLVFLPDIYQQDGPLAAALFGQ